MSYYIIETKNGSIAVDGIFTADQVYRKMKNAGQFATIPRPADPNDLVHRMAVFRLENRQEQ